MKKLLSSYVEPQSEQSLHLHKLFCFLSDLEEQIFCSFE